MRKQFNTFPMDEIAAYSQIMERITSRPKDVSKIILRVLSWIRYSQRLLHADELREVIWVEDTDKQRNTDAVNGLNMIDIIGICESLITCDKTDNLVKFSHITVQEFLEKSNFAGELMTHATLAKTCLTYLNFESFEAPCLDEESDDNRRKEYMFSGYAATYWDVHARNANTEDVLWGDMLVAIIDTFQQEGKRESMLQLRDSFGKKSPVSRMSLLHVLATSRLASYYIPPLSDKIPNVTY
jgi:hypothetical protein